MTKSLIEEINQAVTQSAARGTPDKVSCLEGTSSHPSDRCFRTPETSRAAEHSRQVDASGSHSVGAQQNPQVQIAALDLAESEEDKQIGRSALRPQIGIRTSEGVQRFNLEAFIGKSFRGLRSTPGRSKLSNPRQVSRCRYLI